MSGNSSAGVATRSRSLATRARRRAGAGVAIHARRRGLPRRGAAHLPRWAAGVATAHVIERADWPRHIAWRRGARAVIAERRGPAARAIASAAVVRIVARVDAQAITRRARAGRPARACRARRARRARRRRVAAADARGGRRRGAAGAARGEEGEREDRREPDHRRDLRPSPLAGKSRGPTITRPAPACAPHRGSRSASARPRAGGRIATR